MSLSENNTRRKVKKRRFYKRKAFWLVLLTLAVAAGSVGWVAAERYTRPYRERAETFDLDRINDLEKPSIILGRDGGEVGRVFVQNRSIIPIDKVPEVFIDALKAGEDQRFDTHDGVDYIGVVRAFYLNWKAGGTTQGASTITQQLARNAYDLEGERRKRGESGMQRKLVEAFLAQRIEKQYSKPEILEFYLNRIYFGSSFYGIRSASLGYFGKEPAELTRLESAAIVGCIKRPAALSPIQNPEANQRSRNMVIDRMANLRMTNETEAALLRATPLKLNPKPLRRGTTHLYERIADEIQEIMGEDALAAGGFTIRTTIDSRVQKLAEAKLEESLRKAEAHPGYRNPLRAEYRKASGVDPEYLQGAVLMVDHRSGEVIAHVGGRDYDHAPFDVIEQGRRPLGTAFQPFVYAAALEAGLTPASPVEDEPMNNREVMVGATEGVLGEWGMEVPNPRYEMKPITLRRALESSKTAASVRVANQAGLGKVAATAGAFGLPMEGVELLPRLALGWETASLKDAVRAYAAFARGGRIGPDSVHYVKSVTDEDGRRVFDRPAATSELQVAVSGATAFQIHSMLQGGMERGSAAGSLERLNERPFKGGGKTGTTNDFSDNWFLGYNGRVSCGVWVGFLQSGKSIYEGAFSKDLALPVWEAVMNQANAEFGGRGIPQPESVVEAQVCRVSGQRSTNYCYEMVMDPATGRSRSRPSTITEFFRAGTENLPFCQVHSGSEQVASQGGDRIDLNQLAVIDTSPVRPQAPTLLGDDPYHSVQVAAESAVPAGGRSRRTNVLDGFDLNDGEDRLSLPGPGRLDISPD